MEFGFFDPTSAYIRNEVAVVTQNHSWTTEKKFYLHRCIDGFRARLDQLGQHVDQYIPTVHVSRWLRALAIPHTSGSVNHQMEPMNAMLQLKRRFESGQATEAECLSTLEASPAMQTSFRLFARKQSYHVKNAARLKAVQNSVAIQQKLREVLQKPVEELKNTAVFWCLTGCADISYLSDILLGRLDLHRSGRCGVLTRVNRNGRVLQLRLSWRAVEYVRIHTLPSSIKLSDLQLYFNCKSWCCKELRDAILRICIQFGMDTMVQIIVAANRWGGAQLQRVSDLAAASISHGMGNVYRG